MLDLPSITVTNITHHGSYKIGLSFRYNQKLIDRTRSIKNTRWSKSKNLWHLPFTNDNLSKLDFYFKDIATLKYKLTKHPAHLPKVKPKRHFTNAQRTLLNGYYKFLRGRRYSNSTVKTYTYFIADFVWYYRDKPLNLIDTNDVYFFTESFFLKGNYSISSQRQFISALKLFIVFEPSLKIDNLELTRPKRDKKLPTVLSQNEIITLIRAAKNLKHRVIIALIYSSGLRISELINLKLEDFKFERRQLLISNAKGRKDRYVGISEYIIPLLQNYLTTYNPTYYFVEGFNNNQYSSSSIRKFIKKYKTECGIISNVTPHTLRHSYATHLLENGVNLRHIQVLLGHSKPETTMIYTHVARKDIISIKSPLDSAIDAIKQNKNSEQKFRLSGK